MAAKIGSLRADLTLETARFKAGAGDAQARMTALKNGITADSRQIRQAANDMGVSMSGFSRQLADLKARLDPLTVAQTQYRQEVDLARKALDLGAISGKQYGQAVVEAAQKLTTFRSGLKAVGDAAPAKQLSTEMAALKAQLDPAGTALAAYRKQTSLLREAQRESVISTEQFVAGMRSATAAYRQGTQGVIAANGAAQMGMQQLGFQLNDMATMYAMGAKPMQIFASQAGQVVQAIQLMTGGASKFGKFMSGPWGIAITVGVIALSALLPKLLETNKAMKDVELASNGLSDAQSVLGEMFDLTTGKLKNQNEMLRLNAQLMAINLRAQAQTEKANATSTLGNFSQGSLGLSMGEKALGALGLPVGGSMTKEQAVRDLVADYGAGKVSPIDAAKKAEQLDFSGLAVSKHDFLQAIADGVSSGLKEKTAAAIEKSLDDNSLDPSLRQDPKAKRPKKSKSPDQLDDEYADALGKLNTERLNLEAQYHQGIETKYKAQLAEINDDLAAYKRNVELNKDLTPERKKALISAAEANAQVKRDMAETQRDQEVKAQILDLAMSDLQIQMDQVALRRQLSISTKDQRDADLEMLDLQDRLKTAQLDRIIATEAIGSAAWSNAFSEKQALKSSYDQRRQVVERQHASPMEAYQLNLKTSVANINDAMESIEVEGMQGLTDGIAGAIAGTQKLGDVFKNVAQQIIADLVRIQLQKAIVGSLGNLLSTGSSAFSGFSFESSWLNDPNATVNLAGARATGGPVNANLPYLVGERGPEIIVPGQSGQVIPNHELSGLGSSGGVTNNFYGPGAEEFWGKVNGISSSNANQAVVSNKQRDTRRATRKLGKAA